MLEKSFDPKTAEPRLYQAWEQSGAFKPKMDTASEAYSIVIPPPNVTGSLHMGHALNNTLQDILVRFERMRGKDVLWQPGTDHAGIATQMVVERKLAAQGLARKDMSRDEFLAHVWEWKATSGGNISQQLRRLGASCDWSREKFTLGNPADESDKMAEAVTRAFVELYNDGLIYRDKRLVNWDPHFQTAISDLEVETKTVDGHYWHLRYPLSGGVTYEHPITDEDGAVTGHETRDYIVVATSRPETMLGDTAVAVNPDDERYASLVGRSVDLPIVGRKIPIIADDYADMDKGSGAVKITPAHDFNDYEVGKRAGHTPIEILDKRAHILPLDTIPAQYHGLFSVKARKAVVAKFEELGLLERTEKLKIEQPVGDRSGVTIEPMLTDQWYVNARELAVEAKAAVDDGRTKFVPETWKKTYDNWMNDIQPWCISRQLMWGHQIPVWYDEGGAIFVGMDEAQVQAQAGAGVTLTRDPDVLDTWFSSGLWPFSTMGWPEPTQELSRFYPTSTLITGFDIIFFWIARMLMMGLKFQNDVPFKNIYIHALVLDEQGKKMSKSEGNVIDPIDLIQGIDVESLIEKRTTGLRQPEKAPRVAKETRKQYPDGFEAYGADALRFTLAAMAGMGRNIKLSVDRVAGYRNFGTKLWSAASFGQINGCISRADFDPSICTLPVNQWIVSETVKASHDVTRYLEEFRFNDAADAIYKFTWNTYCAWYIELIKPMLNGDDAAAKAETQAAFAWVLDMTLKLLHPFMPFITEELWEKIGAQRDSALIVADWPKLSGDLNTQSAADDVNWLIRLVTALRSVRAEMNIPPSKKGPLIVVGADAVIKARLERYSDALDVLARVDTWSITDVTPEGSIQTVVDDLVCALPLAGLVDFKAERARLCKQAEKLAEEIAKVDNKLGNARFVDKAPAAVVEEQKTRRSDFTSELKKVNQAIAALPS